MCVCVCVCVYVISYTYHVDCKKQLKILHVFCALSWHYDSASSQRISSTELGVPGEAHRRLLAEFEILSPMFKISTHPSSSTRTFPFTAVHFNPLLLHTLTSAQLSQAASSLHVSRLKCCVQSIHHLSLAFYETLYTMFIKLKNDPLISVEKIH